MFMLYSFRYHRSLKFYHKHASPDSHISKTAAFPHFFHIPRTFARGFPEQFRTNPRTSKILQSPWIIKRNREQTIEPDIPSLLRTDYASNFPPP